ncbi:MAG TPA: precorrin methylase, partial [Sulfitobacter sp.]|nr:precorrin methylase [Sulfitobacter sp.]
MIVAGFGFRGCATIDSLTSAFSETGLSAVDAIATAEDKSKTPVFIDFAKT